MKWQVIFKTEMNDIIYLNNTTTFAIIDGVLNINDSIKFPLVGEKNANLHNYDNHTYLLRKKEIKRLRKAIAWAKFRSALTTSLKWGIVVVVSAGCLTLLNGTIFTAISQKSSMIADTEQQREVFKSSPDKWNKESLSNESIETEKQISQGIKAGEKRNDVSIKFGPENSSSVIYVYSDPSCPHCKEIDSSLQELSKNGVKVVIFPVDVIGGDTSMQAAATIMCLPSNEDKQKAWQQLLSNSNTSPFSTPCQAGVEGVRANSLFFKKAGFIGTPTILNKYGQQPDSDIPATIQGIKEWSEK